ncbi:MAG: elongation factor P [Armatimonadetes bacterium]|nr:elongation factor P [Armatimonadota bacterium]
MVTPSLSATTVPFFTVQVWRPFAHRLNLPKCSERCRRVAIDTSDFQNGMAFYMDGEIYQILEFQHVKPGKGGAFVRTRLKKVKTGNVFEKTFRSGEKFDPCFLEKVPYQFLFRTGSELTFMDLDSYEQTSIPEGVIGDAARFLKDEAEVQALTADGEVLGWECPNFVELAVTESEPGVRGNTASGGVMKGATVETGAPVQVPMHIEVGDVIKIDTRTGSYIERVSKG